MIHDLVILDLVIINHGIIKSVITKLIRFTFFLIFNY